MQAKKFWLIIIWVILFSIVMFFFYKNGFDFKAILSGTHSLGFIGVVIFLALFLLAPVFFIPITPLSITAGMFFGPLYGLLMSVIGATFGATLAFFISRYLVKDWIDKKSPARIMLIQEKLKKYGWKFVAIARISPIFPFSAQNYLFGVTDISVKIYFVTTFLSLMPGTFAYVYLGHAGRSLYAGESGVILQIAIIVVFLIILTFAPYFLKKIRQPVE